MLKNVQKISISEDFSRFPGLRSRKLGAFSGEQFREEILIPALIQGGPITVNLDGVKGYLSSFLEESFGGAVREGHHITRDILTLESDDQSLIEEVWGYIDKEMRKIH
ncbi:MAG: STAS-like domain-containing protein [Betaproteobacteria bacterium]|nr:STAS-like domain-containing protein [Betaproteobacteria bacterium]